MPTPFTVIIAALAMSALVPTSAHAASWQGRVSSVTDGDTLTVSDGERSVVVRLAEIDAPEDGQAWGRQARRALGDLAMDQIVKVDERDTDKYGRTVAHILLGRMDVGEELVRQGHAWHFTRYSDDAHLAELQETARAAHAGLWSLPDPIAPWDYRHPELAANVAEQPMPSSASSTRMAASQFTCGGKRYCKQMTSCEEAQFHLRQCGLSRLDRDGDGVACETLC